MRRHEPAHPRIVEAERTRELSRVPFTDRQVDEAWLQSLLFEHPSLLPVAEIEPAFAPLRAVARELPTEAGPIDLLFVSSTGYLTIVETKLFRSSEARREVVAQILDYAKELLRWTYNDLIAAIRRAPVRAGGTSGDPLLEAARGTEGSEDDEIDPAEFQRTVTLGLRRGRFLLLIVGDEIREDVESLVEYLQTSAHLQFTMGLVSLALYRLNQESDWPLLVVPRVVARTAEIVRAVVRIEGGEELQKPPVVTIPAEEAPTSPTREAFLQAIRGKPDAGLPEKVESLLGALEKLGLYVDPLPSGVALRFPDPGGSDTEFRLLRITNEGRVLSIGRLKKQLEREGYGGDIAIRYATAISAWVPGTRVNPTSGDLDGSVPNQMFPIRLMSESHRDAYLQLVAETLDAIRGAANAKAASH